MKRVFAIWGVCAVIVFLLGALNYLAVQQDLRQTANDPQIEIAEDLAKSMASGVDPSNIGNPAFDLSQSLAPFVAVYDSNGKALAYNATLDGNAPTMPAGIFDYAKAHGQDRFTWEPKKGVRQAVVVNYFSDKASGFVVAGRSLREVEMRETQLEIELAIGIIFIWIISFVMIWFLKRAGRKQQPPDATPAI